MFMITNIELDSDQIAAVLADAAGVDKDSVIMAKDARSKIKCDLKGAKALDRIIGRFERLGSADK